MLIKAAVGALVRDPHTRQPLPIVGGDESPVQVSESDLYWARLLADGDIVVCKPAKPSKAAPSKKDEQA